MCKISICVQCDENMGLVRMKNSSYNKCKGNTY